MDAFLNFFSDNMQSLLVGAFASVIATAIYRVAGGATYRESLDVYLKGCSMLKDPCRTNNPESIALRNALDSMRDDMYVGIIKRKEINWCNSILAFAALLVPVLSAVAITNEKTNPDDLLFAQTITLLATVCALVGIGSFFWMQHVQRKTKKEYFGRRKGNCR